MKYVRTPMMKFAPRSRSESGYVIPQPTKAWVKALAMCWVSVQIFWQIIVTFAALLLLVAAIKWITG